jgi:uncharacterized alkaline shock family protein YloU
MRTNHKEDFSMAESKQYITKIQDNGSIMISEDVIASIVSQSVQEVEGVVGLSVKPGADIADIIVKKNWGKGMRIVIAEDNSLTVDCDILISYGQSVVAVAQNVQETVSSHLESMTGVTVNAVNVNVCGISRQ